MTAAIKNTRAPMPILRPACDFYAIALDNEDYILTRKVLVQHAGSGTPRVRLAQLPVIQFLDLQSNQLTLQSVYPDSSYRITVLLEPACLQLACSCGRRVSKLCAHAYQLLLTLLRFGASTDYFRHFRPGGPARTTLAHPQYFTYKKEYNGLNAKPREELGCVYGLGLEDSLPQLQHLLHLPALEQQGPAPATGLPFCYIILLPRHPFGLPFLLPCPAIWNKARTKIKGFGTFLTALSVEEEHFLSEEQKILHRLCQQLFRKVNQLPALFHQQQPVDHAQLTAIFNLWKKACALLHRQPVYTYPFTHPRLLKKAPIKKWLNKVALSFETPSLSLFLLKHRDYHQLQLCVSINEQEMKEATPVCTFFLQQHQTIYLLPSVRDAALVEWFGSIDNKYTIFNESFPTFEKECLFDLQKHYPIKEIYSI